MFASLTSCVYPHAGMDVPSLYAELGRLVRAHRDRLGLSQADLGRRVGLSRTSITNIERGRQRILVHQLVALANTLEIGPEALLPAAQGEMSAKLDQKLRKHLTGPDETEWGRRIVLASARGGAPDASKD
jgi:transcriptional regulator with XRE-family HTH domain